MSESTVHHLPDAAAGGRGTMPERLAYRYSGRSILVELALDGERFVAASFHATPGTGKVGGVRVGEWKPFFHGAVAQELAGLDLPFLFAIDANEPRSETPEEVTFHGAYAGPGEERLRSLLGLNPAHRGRDLFREWFARQGSTPASDEHLTATYTPSRASQRRFDSLWASQDFRLDCFATEMSGVREAGGDHAMLVADLQLV